MKIKFYITNVYGNERAVLIGDSEKEKIIIHNILCVSKGKTFSKDELHNLTKLGYEFEQTYKPNSFPLQMV